MSTQRNIRQNYNPFGVRGRIGRLGFVITMLGATAVMAATAAGAAPMYFAFTALTGGELILGDGWAELMLMMALVVGVSVVWRYATVAACVKRLADVGWPIWIAVGVFIPLLNIALWIALTVVPGKTGGNYRALRPAPILIAIAIGSVPMGLAIPVAAMVFDLGTTFPMAIYGIPLVSPVGFAVVTGLITVGIPALAAYIGIRIAARSSPSRQRSADSSRA